MPEYPGALPSTLDEAYAVQCAAIDLWPEPIAGWKVAKIAPSWQAELDVDRYIGPIFEGSLQRGLERAFPMIENGLAAFEAEIAVVIAGDADPRRCDWSPAAARSMVGALVMAVEVAGSPLASLSELGPLATIAGFGNNNGLILGSALPQLDKLRGATSICRVVIDDIPVSEATIWAGPDGPLPSLALALNQSARMGHPLKHGQIVSTGALTGVHPVRIGQNCAAMFGEYGEIRCKVMRQQEQPQRALHPSFSSQFGGDAVR